MNFAEEYLNKQNQQFFVGYNGQIKNYQLIVVIPCHDEPDIATTLASVYMCNPPGCNIAIVVVVNDAMHSCPAVKAQNRITLARLKQQKEETPAWISLYAIDSTGLPDKHAGAGWARKVGMDWAISYFGRTSQPDGIIVSLDADVLVAQNYFEAILSFFKKGTEAIAATLYFEHPVSASQQGEAIVLYELYMRYYKHALDYIGFPYSLYTLGSCFAVKAKAYVAQGGMNRRQAGEDFYFLHKLALYGKIGTINGTIVYPSSRISNRVPFGTGPSIQKYIDGHLELQKTYPLEAFLVLKKFFSRIDFFYHKKNLTVEKLTGNKHFSVFLKSCHFADDLTELIANCTTLPVFRKRFFHLFNAFKILKWLNYSVTHGYELSDLVNEAEKLLVLSGGKNDSLNFDAKQMLNYYRYIDKTR